MSDSESTSSTSSSPAKSTPIKRKREPETNEADEELPALSHAERRRQKKKEKLLAITGEADTDKKERLAKKQKLLDGTSKPTGSNSEKEKRQNSVWVGNMSFKTTPDDVRQFFADVGESTRIHMPMKAPTRPGGKPENRGFAYVDFATPELRDAAIKKSEQPLIGRRLLIKDGSSFEGRPAASTDGADASKNSSTLSKTAQNILKAQKQPPGPTLFLGNLAFNTTEASIMELFNAHRKKPRVEKDIEQVDEGENDDDDDKVAKPNRKKDDWLRKVRMGTFEDSGLCKGFAFVDFTTVEHATSVLVNPKNHHLDGRKLVVEYASADAVRRGGGPRPKGFVNEYSRGGKGHRDDARNTERRQKHVNNMEDVLPRKDEADGQEQVEPQSQKPARNERSRPHGDRPRSRPKPGAALALAKRESAVIVPALGKKIVF